MKIIVAEHSGFCYGVKRAVDMAFSCVDSSSSVCTLGPLIHNDQMVNKLEQLGIKKISNLEDIQQGTIIIRSHGVGPSIYDSINRRNLTCVDATCPNVKRAQQYARELAANGYKVVVIGDGEHPEVKSILEWSSNDPFVVDSQEAAQSLPHIERIGVVAQTTFNAIEFDNIVDILRSKCDEIKIARTICQATDLRQNAAIKIARQVDVMIVIGGRSSANTCRLAQICTQIGAVVYHIETAQELNKEWFSGVKTVGITAGASTPDWLIEEVYQKMQEFNQQNATDNGELESGMMVQGKIVRVEKDVVFADIGYKADGIIELTDLAFPIPANAEEVVKEGDLVDVVVLSADNEDGSVKLSKVKADEILAWNKLQDALDKGLILDGQVLSVIKGGLSIAVLGIRGFMPASQVYLKFTDDFSHLVGQDLPMKVIEVNPDQRKAVFSHKQVLQQEMDERQSKVLNSISVGQKIKGTVSRIAAFGAFVDIGGIEGLIHISDLSWQRVTKPEEVVSVGDEVEVTILKVDQESKRIGLSLKDIKNDPWFVATNNLKEGSTLSGKVTKIMSFGAFVEIIPGVEGLVHISEIAENRVSKVEDGVSLGQTVAVKVLSIDKSSKRISLSIAQAQQDQERAEYKQYLNAAGGLNLTIGDKLGHLFKKED